MKSQNEKDQKKKAKVPERKKIEGLDAKRKGEYVREGRPRPLPLGVTQSWKSETA